MRSSLARHVTHVFGEVFLARPGAPARLLLSWTMAGGIAGGGVLIGAFALAGLVEPGAHLFAAQALFLVGAVGGLVHAAALGIVGRPDGLTIGGVCWRLAIASPFVIPAAALAGLITAGMMLSAALLTSWEVSWLVVALLSWAVGLALCAWAGIEGARAVRRFLSRWAPSFGAGSAMAVLTVGIVGALLFWRPPEVLSFDLQLAPFAAAVAGVCTACSVGLPLVCSLHVVGRRLAQSE